MSASSSTSLSALDADLGPVLTRATGTPQKAILAVAVKAATMNLKTALLRRWLLSRTTDPGLKTLIQTQPKIFLQLVKTASAHVGSSSSASSGAAIARAAISKRLASHLLAPIPADCGLSPTRLRSGRFALAIIGAGILETFETSRPMDTTIMSELELAVRMGASVRGARSAVETCRAMGWLAVVSQRAGMPARQKIGRVKTLDAQLRALEEAEDLAMGADAEMLVSRLIQLADHPAWGYSDLGSAGWSTALALATGGDPRDFGVSPAKIPRLKKELAALGIARLTPAGELEKILDGHARESGALSRHQAAVEARAESVRLRLESITESRRAKAEAREVTRSHAARTKSAASKILGGRPVPTPQSAVEDRKAWVRDATAMAGRCGLDSVMVELVRKRVVRALLLAGWPGEKANSVAQAVVAVPQECQAAA